MKRFQLNLQLKGVILIIAIGVLLPVMLSTAVGIAAIVHAGNVAGIVTGVLVISFAATAAGCALIAVVLTGRKARLARWQGDFVANVSHEFRTPLSAIKLYAQTLHSGKLADDPERMAQCTATILRETEWLDVMIDKVLTWRASSRDMMDLRLEAGPVAPAVNDAVTRFQSMVAPGELAFTATVDSRLCVRHDALALNAVVLNLLVNAYKYTGEEKQIGVSVRDEDNHVVIDVRDNGLGLTPAEAKHVFQPFYRADRGDGQEASGVGLGLAIAQNLVKRHGGTLTVSSAKGKGSTFTVSLPGVPEIA